MSNRKSGVQGAVERILVIAAIVMLTLAYNIYQSLKSRIGGATNNE